MCGIAGIVRWDGRPVREDEIRAMCGVMAHRGPDDEGVYIGDGVAHRHAPPQHHRSRQRPPADLATRTAPSGSSSTARSTTTRSCGATSQKRGHTFRTASDTETIVHLYEDLGPRCVDRLRGMFAFAIWDTRRRQVLLARDRLGIKPLYYAERDGELLFASELKPILQLPSVERSLDWEVGRPPVHDARDARRPRSIVEGVSKLEPARVARRQPGTQPPHRALLGRRFRARTSARPRTELVEQLRERARRSRSRCTRSATCPSARSSAAASIRAPSSR